MSFYTNSNGLSLYAICTVVHFPKATHSLDSLGEAVRPVGAILVSGLITDYCAQEHVAQLPSGLRVHTEIR